MTNLDNFLTAPEDREHCPDCDSIDCSFNSEGFWSCNNCGHFWAHDKDDPDYLECDESQSEEFKSLDEKIEALKSLLDLLSDDNPIVVVGDPDIKTVGEFRRRLKG